MTDAEALEAKRIVCWWISKKNSRIQAVQKVGGRNVVVNEVILNLLKYPPKTEFRFTTRVVHMTHWTICRLVYKDVRRIDSIHEFMDPSRVKTVERCDRWKWQQDMEQRDIDEFFWSVFFVQSESNKELSRMAQCAFRVLQGETLESIAPTFGVTRERIRQLAVKHMCRVQGQAERLHKALGEK